MHCRGSRRSAPLRASSAQAAEIRTLFEAADDVAKRVDDVLALRLDAVLLRVTNVGAAAPAMGLYATSLLVSSARVPEGPPGCQLEEVAMRLTTG